MELKWILVLVFEAAFWLMLATFLVLRYRYGMEGITRLFVIGVVVDTAGLLALAAWDFADTGHVSTYTILIGALLVYALTSGRHHFEKLDAWMAQRIRPRVTSRPCPDRP